MIKVKSISIFLTLVLCLNILLPASSLAIDEIQKIEEITTEQSDKEQSALSENVAEEDESIIENQEERTEEIEQNVTLTEETGVNEDKAEAVQRSADEQTQIQAQSYSMGELGVAYSSHVQDYGWEKQYLSNGQTSGTTGKNKKIEAIKIKLINAPERASVKYKAYLTGKGWQDTVSDSELAGTVGENRKMEAIKIGLVGLEDYSIMYRVHLQDKGWFDWVNDGEVTGAINENKKIEAIEIKIVPKVKNIPSVQYRSHVQDYGWEKQYVSNGQTSGTTGKNKKVEATQIKLQNPGSIESSIKYRIFVDGIGWQQWSYDGDLAGTIGENKKVYGIRIALENVEGYSIQYRAHIQNEGWTSWVCNGQTAGNLYKNYKIEAIEAKIVKNAEADKNMYVQYYSHVQDYGWEEEYLHQNDEQSGTTGKNKKVEALKMQLVNAPLGGKIKYRVYVQDEGWQQWNYDGGLAGTIGENKKIYGLRIELDGIKDYSVQYKVHIQDVGWSDWKTDGITAGEVLKGKKIEAVIIRIVSKTTSSIPVVEYSSYVQDYGWEEEYLYQNGETTGRPGENKRIESIKLNLINAPAGGTIKYKLHIEDIGWTDWYSSGEVAGTPDSGKKIEAIQIKLENMNGYTIEYQSHVQAIGWQEWRQDGKSSGTTGKNLKIEALRVQIVEKYKSEFYGIDVSSWQQTIDYNALTSQGNVDFMIIRAGYGRNDYQKDAQFENNYAKAKAYGIPVGVYLYSYATDVEGAKAEAYNMLNWIKGKSFDLPVFYDVEEGGQTTLGKETVTNMCKAFGQIISDAGYDVGVYSYKTFIKNYIDVNKLPVNYSLWVSAFGNKEDGTMPDDIYKYQEYHDIWQYSSTGSVEGIQGRVDMNICYNTSYFGR